MRIFTTAVFICIWLLFNSGLSRAQDAKPVKKAIKQAAAAKEPPTTEALALRILDSEALYTTRGVIKPLSDGFWQYRFPAAETPNTMVETVRQRLQQLPLPSEWETGVLIFASEFEGYKSATAFIAHTPSLQNVIRRKSSEFQPLGIAAGMKAQQILEAIDRSPRGERWRGFGRVFGYPDYAVDFFVQAGESEAKTKQFVERDFLRLPTFQSNEGRFVYAVPKGHQLRAEDIVLKNRTEEIFARYQAWRELYIGEGKAGATELLRGWSRAR